MLLCTLLSTRTKSSTRALLVARSTCQHNPRKHLSSSMSNPSWATYDPKALGTLSEPYAVQNLVGGTWTTTTTGSAQTNSKVIEIPHPLDKDAYPIFTIPDTTDIDSFVQSLRQCPKTGLHNPLKRIERYVQYGEITRKVSGLFLENPFARAAFC